MVKENMVENRVGIHKDIEGFLELNSKGRKKAVREVPKEELAGFYAGMPQTIRGRVEELESKQGGEMTIKNKFLRALDFAEQERVTSERLLQETKEVKKTNEESVKIAKIFRDNAKGGLVNPDDEQGNPLQRRLNATIQENKPIQTVMFWGASDKASMNKADDVLVERVVGLQEEITSVYKHGGIMGIILADVHALNNGHSEIRDGDTVLSRNARNYYKEVEERFGDLNSEYQKKGTPIEFRTKLLSDLYTDHNLSFPSGDYTKEDSAVTEKHRDYLIRKAEKYCMTDIAPEEAATLYVSMRRKEQKILESSPDAILVAPGISKGARDIILPKGMPGVFFGTDLRSPWFGK